MSRGNSVVRTVLLMAFVICSSIVSGATKPECGYMRTEKNSPVVLQVSHEADFVVCGGGLAGVCAAVSAARSSNWKNLQIKASVRFGRGERSVV